MIILVVFLICFVLIKKAKKLSKQENILLFCFGTIYLIGCFLYNEFLKSKGWEFGIPGADMLEHFQAATHLAKGVSWKKLSDVVQGTRFVLSIGTLSYFLYAQLLSCLLYYPTIFSIEVNIYLVYIVQIFLSLIAIINIIKTLKLIFPKVKNSVIVVLVCSFVSFAIQSYQFMRDIYFMLFLSEFLNFIILSNHKKIGQFRLYLVSAILIVICTLLRSYSLLITVPVFLYYTCRKRLAISFCVLCCAIFALNFISALEIFSDASNVSWQLQKVSWSEVIRFTLFPNVINQFKYLLDWDKYFGTSSYLGGCNLPGVYFIMACWNIPVFMLSAIGIAYKFKKNIGQSILWGLILMNVVMLYSINYDTIDTRHKLMMAIPFFVLTLNGVDKIKILSKGDE